MDIESKRSEFDAAIAFLRKELTQINTGRADPSLLEDIIVTAYEAKMKLNELASITVPEPSNLLIEPWDKSLVKDIGGALQDAAIEGQVNISGDSIRFIIPQMTEENRMRYVKQVKEKLEEARIAVRKVRDKIKDKILAEEKAKEISEDEKFGNLKELDQITGQYNDQIKDIGEQKEKELLKI